MFTFIKSFNICFQRSTFISLKSYSRAISNPKKTVSNESFLKINQDLKSPEDLAAYLYENILYQNDHFVVFNKPNGIAMHSPKYSESSTQQVDPATPTDFLSMASSLNLLKDKLGKNALLNVYSQNRLYSGPVVYCFSEEMKGLLSKYFRNARANKHLVSTYKMVTIGEVRRRVEGREEFYVQKTTINNTPSILYNTSLSENKIRHTRGIHTKVVVNWRVVVESRVAYNCTINLLELAINTASTDILQLFSLHNFSPVLGDHIYSSRLRLVLDKAVLVDPLRALHEPQDLDAEVCTRLGLGVEDTCTIPLHVHCTSLVLPSIWSAGGAWRYSNKAFSNDQNLNNLTTAEQKDDLQNKNNNNNNVNKNKINMQRNDSNSNNINNINNKHSIIVHSPLPKFFEETLKRLEILEN